ncbi:hypothetical protein TNCV_459211 [Trichonephila clavipes]|nr:hypothetical protein TNCV_459211 [Trichonephila clavipes]
MALDGSLPQFNLGVQGETQAVFSQRAIQRSPRYRLLRAKSPFVDFLIARYKDLCFVWALQCLRWTVKDRKHIAGSDKSLFPIESSWMDVYGNGTNS